MKACLFDRRAMLMAYDAAMAVGATSDTAVGVAITAARASDEDVTDVEVRRWLAEALARRRLAIFRRQHLTIVQGGRNRPYSVGRKSIDHAPELRNKPWCQQVQSRDVENRPDRSQNQEPLDRIL
jgi:hypothetical protein